MATSSADQYRFFPDAARRLNSSDGAAPVGCGIWHLIHAREHKAIRAQNDNNMLLKVIMTISDVECIANSKNACIPVHLTISGLLTLRLSAVDMHGGAAWWLYALWGELL
jgi:hypothetical protein